MRYIEKFLELKCTPDILGVSYPLNNPTKEVTESMAIVQELRKVFLKDKERKVVVFDLCAGNALTSVILAHLFPNVTCYALDKAPRDRQWENVKNFEYKTMDIHEKETIDYIDIVSKSADYSIIISVHPCKNLANRIVDIYKLSSVNHIALMPCCKGKIDTDFPQVIKEKVSNYMLWCWDLSRSANAKLRMDKYIKSPCNGIISGSKSVEGIK